VNVHLDIIASFVIGGMLMLMLINMNAGLVACTTDTVLSQITQINAMGTAEVIRADLKRAGLRVPAGLPAFLSASPEAMTILGDIDGDGAHDTLTYFLAVGGADNTPNPNDRMMYRRDGANAPEPFSAGITGFEMTYRDEFGNVKGFPIAGDSALASIRRVDVVLVVESTERYGEEFQRFVTEFTVRPKSL
jgi:hypothetical protein